MSELQREQPWWKVQDQPWAEQHVQASHVDALYTERHGSKDLFCARLWKAAPCAALLRYARRADASDWNPRRQAVASAGNALLCRRLRCSHQRRGQGVLPQALGKGEEARRPTRRPQPWSERGREELDRERLRHDVARRTTRPGAPGGDGADSRTTPAARRDRAPQERDQGRQPSGEPGVVVNDAPLRQAGRGLGGVRGGGLGAIWSTTNP